MKLAIEFDWGGNTIHGRSVTSFTLKLSISAIYYKTRYQNTITLSSTQAEFDVAIYDGKAIIYIRTINHEIELL